MEGRGVSTLRFRAVKCVCIFFFISIGVYLEYPFACFLVTWLLAMME